MRSLNMRFLIVVLSLFLSWALSYPGNSFLESNTSLPMIVANSSSSALSASPTFSTSSPQRPSFVPDVEYLNVDEGLSEYRSINDIRARGSPGVKGKPYFGHKGDPFPGMKWDIAVGAIAKLCLKLSVDKIIFTDQHEWRYALHYQENQIFDFWIRCQDCGRIDMSEGGQKDICEARFQDLVSRSCKLDALTGKCGNTFYFGGKITWTDGMSYMMRRRDSSIDYPPKWSKDLKCFDNNDQRYQPISWDHVKDQGRNYGPDAAQFDICMHMGETPTYLSATSHGYVFVDRHYLSYPDQDADPSCAKNHDYIFSDRSMQDACFDVFNFLTNNDICPHLDYNKWVKGGRLRYRCTEWTLKHIASPA